MANRRRTHQPASILSDASSRSDIGDGDEIRRSLLSADHVRLIPATILAGYASVAEAAGLNAIEMLHRVGLDPRCLSNQKMPLLTVRATELIELSAIEAGVSDFGLRLALARGTPDIGPLNLLLREEPDLRSALRSLQSHLHLHSRSISMFLEEPGDVPILHVGFAPGTIATSAPQSTEMVVCGLIHTLRWLIGADWAPELVGFSHCAPASILPQRRAFKCDVAYMQSFDGIVLRRSDLDQMIATSGSLLRQYAEDYIRTLSQNSASEFADVVGQLVAAMLPTGSCSAAAISRHLGMERSTLGRRLALSGETYSSVLQRMRMRLAAHYCTSRWAFPDVADQLGFASISVFSRWFKTSFGQAPSLWRRVNLLPAEGTLATASFVRSPDR